MNIIFIGGVHGVGKGALCKGVCNEVNITHLTASDVLRWDEISDKANKLVNDFKQTQNRLITNLNHIVTDDRKYILDGHYCLLNTNNVPERIDFDTFAHLNPLAFVIIIDNIQDIQIRLEKRDSKKYDLGLLQRFQEEEFEYSLELSHRLSKPHLILNKEEEYKLITFLRNENFA